MKSNWYANTKGIQGLIYEEKSGKNIAVSYDKDDAPLIAASPEMLALLQDIRRYLEYPISSKSDRNFVIDRINEVIRDLEQEKPTKEGDT